MLLIALGVVAVTELLKRLHAKDWEGAAVIVLAAVLGAIAGLAKLDGLTVSLGVQYALSAVGIHTIARQVG